MSDATIEGHEPTCDVTRHRVELLGEIEAAHRHGNPGPLLDAAIEWYGGGDQEAETCTCGAEA